MWLPKYCRDPVFLFPWYAQLTLSHCSSPKATSGHYLSAKANHDILYRSSVLVTILSVFKNIQSAENLHASLGDSVRKENCSYDNPHKSIYMADLIRSVFHQSGISLNDRIMANWSSVTMTDGYLNVVSVFLGWWRAESYAAAILQLGTPAWLPNSSDVHIRLHAFIIL